MIETIETNDKKTWENGDIIDATSLNDIEDAIATPYGFTIATVTSVYDGSTGTTTYTCDKTSTDIFNIMKSGNMVVAYFDNYYIEDGQRLWDRVNFGEVINAINSSGAHFFFNGADWQIDSEGNVTIGGTS